MLEVTGPKSLAPFEEQLVTFASLIPCSQHHRVDSSLKANFEAAMEAFEKEMGMVCEDRHQFFQGLISHPVNKGLQQHKWNKGSDISWEGALCLMRNIVAHEHRFDWQSLRELGLYCGQFFGNIANLDGALRLFYQHVLVPHYSKVEGEELLSDPIASVRQKNLPWESEEEKKQIVLLFMQLIPCRMNNSIVDDTFEEDMDQLVMQSPKDQISQREAALDTFLLYLRTHVANPEQHHTKPCDISWLMVVRMMRNIFCHEYDFVEWTMLRELQIESFRFFGGRKGFQQVLELYQRKCSTPLLERSTRCKSSESSVLPDGSVCRFSAHQACVFLSVDYRLVAKVQLSFPKNTVTLHTGIHKSVVLYHGLLLLDEILAEYARSLKVSSTCAPPTSFGGKKGPYESAHLVAITAHRHGSSASRVKHLRPKKKRRKRVKHSASDIASGSGCRSSGLLLFVGPRCSGKTSSALLSAALLKEHIGGEHSPTMYCDLSEKVTAPMSSPGNNTSGSAETLQQMLAQTIIDRFWKYVQGTSNASVPSCPPQGKELALSSTLDWICMTMASIFDKEEKKSHQTECGAVSDTHLCVLIVLDNLDSWLLQESGEYPGSNEAIRQLLSELSRLTGSMSRRGQRCVIIGTCSASFAHFIWLKPCETFPLSADDANAEALSPDDFGHAKKGASEARQDFSQKIVLVQLTLGSSNRHKHRFAEYFRDYERLLRHYYGSKDLPKCLLRTLVDQIQSLPEPAPIIQQGHTLLPISAFALIKQCVAQLLEQKDSTPPSEIYSALRSLNTTPWAERLRYYETIVAKVVSSPS